MADPVPVSTVKPGIKTTEFALTIFVNVVTIGMTFVHMLPASLAALLLVIINSVYNIGRVIVKNGDPAYVAPVLPVSVTQVN